MNEIFSIAISIVAALFLYYLFMSLFIYLVELKDYNTKYRIISTRNEFIVQHSLFGLIWTTEQVCIGHTAISEDEFSYDRTFDSVEQAEEWINRVKPKSKPSFNVVKYV